MENKAVIDELILESYERRMVWIMKFCKKMSKVQKDGVFRDLHKLVLKLLLSDLVNSRRQFPMNHAAAHYQSDNTGNNHVFQVSK